MFEIATHLALILILAAFLAGFVDSIAGGGGLISVPMLLLCGLTPVEVLATNKLQGSFGAGAAALAYARAGHVRPTGQWPMALAAGVAGGAGAWLAQGIPADLLRVLMPLLLIAVAVYFGLKPGLSDEDGHVRLGPVLFGALVVPVIGFYDGFFGPGTGSFFMLAFVTLAGHGVLKATAHTKFLNFASNAGSVAVFAGGGEVLWATGLAMAAAQVAGAILGARLAMRLGAGLIRPLLVAVCLALAARLLWQVWG